MKKAYPVILSPAGDGWYVATVPDLDVNTQGKDLADAIYMARDVIGWRGIDMENAGQTLPEASAIETVKGSGAEDVVTLVDVDFDEYRRQNDLRSVKKNCTIPAWLNYEAERRGINFSALLQSALKKELSVKDLEKNAG